MPLQLHHKYLALFVLLIFLLNNINASEKSLTLACQEKALTISIQGTKTKFSKLKKIILSESDMFKDMTEAQSIDHIKKVLQDTGLFESVSADKKDDQIVVTIKDTFTLLPIINFSTNLESFSYTAGISESDLFNNMWQVAGAWSQSANSKNLFYSLGVAYPTKDIQSINLGGVRGDSFFYYQKKWYQYDVNDIYLTIRFKEIFEQQKINYGAQIRYTQFEFLDSPTLNASVFASIGKYYRNHDISEGYQFNISARYIEDRFNHYTFNANFQKNWYIPIQNNSIFRGFQIDYHADYSNIDEDRSAVGVIFSYRSGALHGLRSNSIFENNFGSTGLRFGITSQKFLWTYWQPHVFMEAGLSDHDSYYSVGGGILLTFPALYNSRLRIQYYQGELPDSLNGIIISTSLDF